MAMAMTTMETAIKVDQATHLLELKEIRIISQNRPKGPQMVILLSRARNTRRVTTVRTSKIIDISFATLAD
jgi:hypothetical protein